MHGVKEVRPAMTQPTAGYRIGQLCPVCKLHCHRRPGRLFAITPSPLFKIDHLECRKCHRSFESRDKGKTLTEYREQDLATFKNPAKQPRLCPRCNRQHVMSGPIDPDPKAWMKPREPRSEYLFCGICQRICWVIRIVPRKT